MIGAGAARNPPDRARSPVFHKQMPDKCASWRIRMFTPGAVRLDRLLLTFEIPLSSAAHDPSLPRAVRIRHQAESLVSVFLGLNSLL